MSIILNSALEYSLQSATKKHWIGIMKRAMNREQKQVTGGCWKMLLNMATITENNKNIHIYTCKSTPAFTQGTF